MPDTSKLAPNGKAKPLTWNWTLWLLYWLDQLQQLGSA